MASRSLGTLTLDLVARIGGFTDGMDKAQRAAREGSRGINKEVKGIEKSMSELERVAGRLKGALAAAFGGVGFAGSIRSISQISDEYANLTGRLKLVTSSSQELAYIQQQLFQVAQQSGTDFIAVGNLYARVARNAGELGLSQQKLLTMTKAVNQAIQVGGSNAQEAAAGVIQLSQALASGRLNGDEFRSVMENMPRVAQALADGLGTSIGSLRDLSKEGKLTAEVVSQALLSQADVIQKEFEVLPETVGRAMTRLQNEFRNAISTADTMPIVEALNGLRSTLTDPAVTEGLVTIASAMARIADVGAKAATGFAEFGQALGYTAARLTGSVDEVSKLETEIKQLQKTLGLDPGWERWLFAPVAWASKSNDELKSEVRKRQLLLAQMMQTPAASMELLEEAQRRYALLLTQYNQALAAGNNELASGLAPAVQAARSEMERMAKALNVTKEGTDGVTTSTVQLGGASEEAEKKVQRLREELERFFRTGQDAKSIEDILVDGIKGMAPDVAWAREYLGAFGQALEESTVPESMEMMSEEFLNQIRRNAEQGLKEFSDKVKPVVADLDSQLGEPGWMDNWASSFAEMGGSLEDALTQGLYDSFKNGGNFAENIFDNLVASFQTKLTKAFVDSASNIKIGDIGTLGQIAELAAMAYGVHQLGASIRPHQSNVSRDAYGFLATNPITGPIAAIDALTGGSVFGTKWATNKHDLSLDFMDGAIDALIFRQEKKKRALGGSSKTRDFFDDAEELDNELSGIFGDIYSAISDGADRIGLTVGSFEYAFKESIKGLSAEEIQALIDGAMRDASDALATQVIPNIREYQRANEELANTVIRVINETVGAQRAINYLGGQLEILSGQAGVEMVQSLAELGGGFDTLMTGVRTFFDSFYSDQDKFVIGLAQMNDELDRLGVTLPENREGWKELVTGLDLTTEAGRELFAALTGLSGAASSLYAEIEASLQSQQALISMFSTEAQNTEYALSRVTEGLAELGYEFPATEEAMRGLIESIDATSVEGINAMRVLAELGPMAKQYYDSLKALEEERQRASEELARELSDQGKAYDDLAKDFSKALADIQKAFEDFMEASGRVRESIATDILSLRRMGAGWDEVAHQASVIEDLRARLGVGSPEEQIAVVDRLRQAIMARHDAELEGIERSKRAAEEVYQEQMRVFEEQRRALESIRRFAHDLLFSDMSILTPQEQLAQALKDFDAAGLMEFEDASRRLLETAREVYGAGGEYSDIFRSVLERANGMRMTASAPVDPSLQWQERIGEYTERTAAEIEALIPYLQDAEDEARSNMEAQTEAMTAQFKEGVQAIAASIADAVVATIESNKTFSEAEIAALRETSAAQIAAMITMSQNMVAAAQLYSKGAVQETMAKIKDDSANGKTILYSKGVAVKS